MREPSLAGTSALQMVGRPVLAHRPSAVWGAAPSMTGRERRYRCSRAGVQVDLTELERVRAGFLDREARSRRGRGRRRMRGRHLVQYDRHHAEHPDEPTAPGTTPAGAGSRSLAGTSLLVSGPRIVGRTVQLRTAINSRPANHRTSAPLLRTHRYGLQCSPCPLAPFCAITCCSGSPLTTSQACHPRHWNRPRRATLS
jgi:hypothetical protein